MRFSGWWERCFDGESRPVVLGRVSDAAGDLHELPLMVDSGADATVLSAEALQARGFEPGAAVAAVGLEGVGGRSDATTVESSLWLRTDAGVWVPFHIPLRSSASVDTFGVSVLGRDALDHLAVIVDRPGNVVCLLAGNHRYVIQGS